MQSYDGTVVESRPDWLTITATDEVDRLVLEKRAARILFDERTKGDDLKPLLWRGYDGAQTRHCQYGQRHDSDLLRLSGPLAAEHLDAVLPLAHNVTRLDVCVTCRLPGVTDELIRTSYEQARNQGNAHGPPVDYQILEHSRRGSTLYVGARSSRTFGRVYNKFTESQRDYFRDCFRYEVEAKGEAASALARAVIASADRASAIRQYVHKHFSERGLPLPFDGTGDDLQLPPYRRHPDDISRLLWLQRQVAPTIRQLAKRGLRDAAAQALTLTDYITPLDI